MSICEWEYYALSESTKEIDISDIQNNFDAPDASELPDRHYLIEDIIPECSINILGGPPDAGKSTWLLKAMESFVNGEDILGKKTNPCKIAYWNADRELRDIYETMKRLNIPLDAFPMYADMSEATKIEDIPNIIPGGTKLLIIEAIGVYVADGRVSDYTAVARWFRTLRRICHLHDLTIIGTHHTAKAREGDGYSDPRQRMLGSTSWAGFVDTKLVIEPTNMKDVNDPSRRFYVMPKNRPASEHELTLVGCGTFVSGKAVDLNRSRLLLLIPYDTPVTRKFIVEAGVSIGIPAGSVRNHIDRFVACGELLSAKTHKGTHGTYVKPLIAMPGGIVLDEGEGEEEETEE